jgi:type I restriction enzyme, S subunit
MIDTIEIERKTKLTEDFCTIGDVIDMQSGVAFKKSEYSHGGVRLFQIANVSFNYIKWDEIEYLPEDYVNRYPELLLKDGDIVMALNRPLLNDQLKIAQLRSSDTPAILYQRVGRFKFLREENHRYFLYFLQSPVFITWLKGQLQGVNIPFINKSKLLAYDRYPNRNLKEQQQIVSKIEELFSEIDKGTEEIKTAQQQLKVYRQAVLKWAFEGKLTNEDVEEGELPHGWKWVKIDDLLLDRKKGMATGPFGTMLKKHEHLKEGVAVLGIENIGEGIFQMPNKIFVSDDKAKELKNFKVNENDIIISRSGTVGEICLVPINMIGSIISTNLIKVSLNTTVINPKFFVYLFQGGQVRQQVFNLCKGSSRAFLNQTILLTLDFPYCCPEEQQQIVQEIESRLSVCDKIEETITNSLKQAEALRQSILKKAFEGKLV